jgi:uncharacterized protein YndB with AHSA1/START domain
MTSAEPIVVTRTFRLPIDAAEAWSLIGDGDRWPEWLVDEGEVTVAEGVEGEVVDDGETLHVRIREVDPGRSVAYDWCPSHRPERRSSVCLEIVEVEGGIELRVLEVLAPHHTGGTAVQAMAWDVRALRASMCAMALATR